MTTYTVPKFEPLNPSNLKWIKQCYALIEWEIANPHFNHQVTGDWCCMGWDNYRLEVVPKLSFDLGGKYADDFSKWMTYVGEIRNLSYGRDIMREQMPCLYYLTVHTGAKWHSGFDDDIPYRKDLDTGEFYMINELSVI